jgi:hypothetical protein
MAALRQDFYFEGEALQRFPEGTLIDSPFRPAAATSGHLYKIVQSAPADRRSRISAGSEITHDGKTVA